MSLEGYKTKGKAFSCFAKMSKQTVGFNMEKDIGKIRKNDRADIIIRVDDFGGRKGLTIREFVTGERYTGFTKAGVKIPAADFPKFKEMINSISEKDMEETEESEKPKKELSEDQKTLDNSKEEYDY